MQEARESIHAVVLSVSELALQLRETLLEEFGAVLVEGEIGSLHRSRAGHVYFDLKDEQAQLRAVLFRRSSEALAFEPEDGMLVRAQARVDLYLPRGQLQLVVEDLEPWGEGALRRAFEQLRARLAAEGLFDPAHKKPLPFLPRCIGLVTSAQGAAIHDFLRVLGQRFPSVEVLVCDARVQGEGAWRELVRGIHRLDARPEVDVIVLARGGGSLEDLWSFNREELARAVFELETPVVSAIGHEVDVVLTDLVADVRAATPTMAAELVVPEGAALGRRLDELGTRLRRHLRLRVETLRHRLEALRRGLVHPGRRLSEVRRRLGDGRARLLQAAGGIRTRETARLERLSDRLGAALRRLQERRGARLEELGGRLGALSPLAVLARGYSIARREEDGAILTSSDQVRARDRIELRLSHGRVRASVTGTVPPESEET